MRRWFVWIVFAPAILSLVWVASIAIRTWSRNPGEAIVLALLSVPTLILLVRMARQRSSQVLPSDPTWTLSGAQFDYIVWIAIGVPIVLVIGLALLLLGR